MENKVLTPQNKVLIFQTENDYLEWESQEGNCIYALQDTKGRYIGDIKESDLVPLWDEFRVTSFNNPQSKQIENWQKNNIEWLGKADWSITNDNDKGIWDKLVQIRIENK